MTTSANPLAGRNFRDETGAPVMPGYKLGEGGEGVVHLVEGDSNSVMKIWHPGRSPQDADVKIRHMVNNPVQPELGATWHITWPQHMVLENGGIAGYTMPILNPGESWEPIVEYYNRRAAQGTEAAQGRELRIDDRVRMARNLALGFRAVHGAGYVIGDVNEKNVEVNRQNDIAMVDCDSYGFTDSATGQTFSNNMGRPEFQAPEVQGDYANRTQDHDLFGLAVVVFHLLTGYHPYTVTNRPNYALPGERISAWLFAPASGGRVTAPGPYNEAWDALTDRQKELFLRCFDQTHQGRLRPTPEEWVEALLEMPVVTTPPSQPTQLPAPPPRRQPAPMTPRPTPPPRPAPTSTAPKLGKMWVYWVFALAGHMSLYPLIFFSTFNPWWWLTLGLLGTALLFIAVRGLFQRPITKARWVGIGVASLSSVWLALLLGDAAMRTWPWWMWLVAILVIAIFLGLHLDLYKDLFTGPSVRNRRMAIGAVSLLALFMLGNLAAAGIRDWSDGREERRLQESRNMAAAVSGGGEANPPEAAVPVETRENIEDLEKSTIELAERLKERLSPSCQSEPQVAAAVEKWEELGEQYDFQDPEDLTDGEKIEFYPALQQVLEELDAAADAAGCP